MLILVSGLLLSGCGNSSKTGAKSQTSASSQTLVMQPAPNGNYQDNFNPFSSAANPGTYGLIYQPMYYFSTTSQNQYAFLATNYDWKNQNKTLEVTLRNNVKWSDGQPFSADDVVFSFNLLKQYPGADTTGIWQELKSVNKVSNTQVDFNFSSPNVPFQTYILQQVIVPQHIWKNLGDPTKASITKPVGTGPYLLDTFSTQDYRFKKNTNYYDAKSYAVQNIDFPAFDSNESAQLAIANGSIDWAGVFIPNVDQVYASKNPHNHYWFPTSGITTLYTNLKNPLLSQLPVRKAISMAIDREKLNKTAEYGTEPVASPTGLLPRDQTYVIPKYKNIAFKYDPKAAEKILTDAGYKKNSSGIFVSPSGKELSFNLLVVSGWSDWVSICQILSTELKAIGINVQVEQPQYGAYASKIQSGNYDLAISWTDLGPTPYTQFQDMLNSKGKWNVEKWNDPATDQALKEFRQSTDPSVQKQAMAKLQDVMVNNLPVIPLLYGASFAEYRDAKFTGFPDKNNPYVTPLPSSWPAPAVILSKLKPVK